MSFPLFLEQAFNGLQFGMLLFLMAAGVTLVFGVMQIINLAHGAMFMLGAFFAAVLYEATGSFPLSVLLALAGVVVVAIAVEVAVIRPLYGRGHLDQVLATFGLSLIFNEVAVILWGRAPLFMEIPEFLSGEVEIVPGSPYPAYRLAITAVALLVGGALYALIAWTRVGMLIRAGANDRGMVAALGVDIVTLNTLVFALGALLAGLAGLMTGPLLSIQSGMGEPILILTLVVIIVGGIGSIRGAFVAALIVGLIDTFGRILLPQIVGGSAGNALANMMVYLLMAAVLLWRPTGLLPARG